MSYRSIYKDLYRTLCSDPFWPILYFSWVYYHWTGRSVIYGTIFSFAVIMTHSASWLFIYNKVLLESVRHAETNVSVTLYYCMMFTRTLIAPFIVMVWMIRGRNRVYQVFSFIVNVDGTLSKFGQCPSRISTLWKLFLPILLPFTLIGGLTWLDMINDQQLGVPETHRILFIHAHYHDAVELFIHYFFACLALLLGDRYNAVNSVLKKKPQEYNTKDLVHVRQSTLDWIITVRELRGVHRKLFFAVEKISEAFSFQLLIITIVSLISVVGDLYNFYLLNALPCASGSAYPTIYLLWCFVHACPLCITAFCCSWTSAQEKCTAALLQEMIVSDENLRMEISTFSHQLIHYDLHFSVCGFYNVGLSFLRTIIGTVATYLVILIQIERPPRNCRNRSTLVSGNVNNYSTNYYSDT